MKKVRTEKKAIKRLVDVLSDVTKMANTKSSSFILAQKKKHNISIKLWLKEVKQKI